MTVVQVDGASCRGGEPVRVGSRGGRSCHPRVDVFDVWSEGQWPDSPSLRASHGGGGNQWSKARAELLSAEDGDLVAKTEPTRAQAVTRGGHRRQITSRRRGGEQVKSSKHQQRQQSDTRKDVWRT